MKVTSTITRAQSEAKNIPRLPRPIDEMDDLELYNFLSKIREDRIVATEKRRAVRDKNKKAKNEDRDNQSKVAATSGRQQTFEEALQQVRDKVESGEALEDASVTDNSSEDE